MPWNRPASTGGLCGICSLEGEFDKLIPHRSEGGRRFGVAARSISFFKDHGAELMTKKIATSFICYQAMGQAVKDMYRDELLRDAGIDV